MMIVVGLVVLCVMLVGLWALIARYITHHIRSMRHSGGVPYVGSFDHHIKLLHQHKDLIPPRAVIYDLGCGDGKMLRFFARYRSIDQAHGRDIHAVAIGRGRLCNRIQRHHSVHLHRADFFSSDIAWTQADVIYCYLFDHIMEKVSLLLDQELAPGTIIIANTFTLPQTDRIQLQKTIYDIH